MELWDIGWLVLSIGVVSLAIGITCHKLDLFEGEALAISLAIIGIMFGLMFVAVGYGSHMTRPEKIAYDIEQAENYVRIAEDALLEEPEVLPEDQMTSKDCREIRYNLDQLRERIKYLDVALQFDHCTCALEKSTECRVY